MKKVILVMAILAVIVAGCQTSAPAEKAPSPQDNAADSPVQDTQETPPIPPDPEEQAEDIEKEDEQPEDVEEDTSETVDDALSVKEIEMEAFKFGFEPSTITVKEGQTVRITAMSTDVGHGIAIPEFGVSETLPVGEEVTFEFTADRKGTYTFFCNVYCGSGHSSMQGTLIVE